MNATIHDIEVEKAARMKPFRLGSLSIEGHRLRLVCDASLTRGSAITLAQNLIELAKQLPAGAR